MTDVDTAELRRLAEAATPGPWESPDDYDVFTARDHKGSRWMVCERAGEDAAYIAAVSPDVLVALLDRLERAEELNRDRSCGALCMNTIVTREHP